MWSGYGNSSSNEPTVFFYLTLKKGDPAAINALFQRLQHEIALIVDGVIELAYFMRGAIGYEEMMLRTPGERQRISKFIDSRLESQKKALYPVY